MNYIETTAGLLRALDIHEREVISLVGGGGKTTLMFALARELGASGRNVVTTTTTKILGPSAGETLLLILEADEERLVKALLRNIEAYRHITVASGTWSPGKLNGIRPELVVRLAESGRIPHVIVEADGAAHRPLKAPREGEPVIPANTSLVIPVVGVDAVGCRLVEECVFRSEIASRLLGLSLGEVVTAEHIARLLTHPQGIAKGSPAAARIIPFVNKVDLDPGLSRARELAYRILAAGHPQIDRVVLGQAQSDGPATVIKRG